MAQIIDYFVVHIAEYLLFSAGFGIVAVCYSLYVTRMDNKKLFCKHNTPSLFVLLGIVGGGIIYSSASEEVIDLQERSNTSGHGSEPMAHFLVPIEAMRPG